MNWRKKNQAARNRTVSSGGPPKTVFSYHSKRTDGHAKTGRQNTQKHSRAIFVARHLPFVIAVLALLISVGYLSTLNLNPKIVSVSNQNERLLRAQDVYASKARDLLAGSVLNRTKITINANKFEADMRRSFPELASVAITLPIMGRRPIVKLEAAQPVLTYKADNTESYLIDINGRVILRSADADEEVVKNLPTIIDKSKLQVELGKGVLTADETEYILTVLNQLKAKNVGVEGLTLPAIASELHVKIAEKPYFVKFDLQGDARLQSGTFFAVKTKLEADNETANEYIDVRVEEKAYFR